MPSPTCTLSPLPETPHFYSASLSRQGSESGIEHSSFADPFIVSPDPQPYLGRPRRTRKISVSPADLALLSDQNAELLSKLEKLEAESVQADQAGRRKLMKLEKDISGLKEELELTRQRGEELEEKAKNNKTPEWKEKVKELRRRPSLSEDEHEEVRDFAPGGALASASSPLVFPSSKSTELEPEQVQEPSQTTPTRPTFSIVLNPSTPTQLPRSESYSSSQSTPRQELALVSQLLLKIRELEETNTQITQQQADTSTKLASVQRDAETIGRVYECLGGQAGVDWEIVPEDGEAQGIQAEDGGVIRFRSLRRTLEGDLSKALGASGLQAVVKDRNARPSVVGFFDSVPDSSLEEPDVTIRGSHGFLSPGTPTYGQWDNSSADPSSSGPMSPALSTLSILTPHSQALQQLAQMETNHDGQTLSSELGSELGYDLGQGQAAPSHHLRTSSLYDLTAIGSPSPALLHRPSNPTPNHARQMQTSDSQLSGDSSSTCADERSGDTFPGHASRQHRMSQSIRMRTNRWVDGRFKGMVLGDETNADLEKDKEISTEGTAMPLPIPVPERLARAFNNVMEAFSGVSGAPTSDKGQTDDGWILVQRDPNSTSESETEAKQGIAAFILELWIWFQFAIIILVFIWAMAKRGPKNVLGTADRKR
jgi:hypothetical protein